MTKRDAERLEKKLAAAKAAASPDDARVTLNVYSGPTVQIVGTEIRRTL